MEIPETMSTLGTSATGQRETILKKNKAKYKAKQKNKTKQNKTKQENNTESKKMSNIDPTIQLVQLTACAT